MHISKFRLSMNLINVNGSLYMKLYTVASFIFKKGVVARVSLYLEVLGIKKFENFITTRCIGHFNE